MCDTRLEALRLVAVRQTGRPKHALNEVGDRPSLLRRPGRLVSSDRIAVAAKTKPILATGSQKQRPDGERLFLGVARCDVPQDPRRRGIGSGGDVRPQIDPDRLRARDQISCSLVDGCASLNRGGIAFAHDLGIVAKHRRGACDKSPTSRMLMGIGLSQIFVRATA